MATVDLVIKDGTVVTPHGVFRAAVAIDDGLIAGIGSEGSLPKGDRVINAQDRYIFPGVIDPHTHPGSQAPFSEDVRTMTRLAAYGGTTTVIATTKSTRIGRTYKEISDPEDAVSYLKVFPEAKEIIEENSVVDF